MFPSHGGRACGAAGCRAGGPAGRGPADADRRVPGPGRGLGGEVERRYPRRCGARQAGGAGVRGVGAHHPPGGRAGEGGLPVGAGAGAPAVDHRAGAVAAVRLRRRPGRRRGEDGAVLRVAGLVPVPGGAAAAGQDPAIGVRRAGRHAAPPGRGADVRADRQREDRHHRACRRDPGAQPADAGLRRALRGVGEDVRAGRPGQQGRQRSHGEAGQGRPGAHGGEPAGRL